MKALITQAQIRATIASMDGRLNGIQCYQLWELLLKREISLFILRFHARLNMDLSDFRYTFASVTEVKISSAKLDYESI
jgi:hypothetical protein